MILGTAVFQRILMEHRQEGFKEAREVGVRALTDTMIETVRFGTFSSETVKDCAEARFNQYARDPNATTTNQVI